MADSRLSIYAFDCSLAHTNRRIRESEYSVFQSPGSPIRRLRTPFPVELAEALGIVGREDEGECGTFRGWTDVRTRRAAIGKVSNELHNGFGMGRAVPPRIHAEHNASVPQTITKEDAPRIRPADAGYFQIPESLAEIHNFWLIRQRACFVSRSGIAWFHWQPSCCVLCQPGVGSGRTTLAEIPPDRSSGGNRKNLPRL